MNYKVTNAYYFRNINSIGGIESHLYYIARKYGKYDIAVFYKSADTKQIRRLSKYIRVIPLQDKDTIECDVLFCCFNKEVLDVAKAKKKILVLHGDYKAMVEKGQMSKNNLPIDDRIDEYIGVSQTTCDSWKELTGLDAKNVYQPIILNKERPLMFISATRLTAEKGWTRMVKLAEELNKAKVNYQWLIYTDTPRTPIDNMVFIKPRLDITDKLQSFDAFIQLSDNEGYCLSVVESLAKGVPCIVTDLPVFKELGLDESNSIKLSLDMNDIPVDKIKNIYKKKFKYEIKKDKWDEVLIESTNTYKTKDMEVIATGKWKEHGILDAELNIIHEEGDKWKVSFERYLDIKEFENKSKIKLLKE